MAHDSGVVPSARRARPHEGRIVASVCAIAVVLGACQSKQDPPRPATDRKACTRVGQTCEFSPNKLGSCVQRDNCTEDCLVCQSQH